MPAVIEVLLLPATLLRAAIRARADVAAEKLLLRHQLAVLTRPTRRRPRPRTRDKLFWVVARLAWRDWRRHLVLVEPETVVRWHRRGWRLFWRWRSHGRLGRPRVNAEVRELIATMARDNPRWGGWPATSTGSGPASHRPGAGVRRPSTIASARAIAGRVGATGPRCRG